MTEGAPAVETASQPVAADTLASSPIKERKMSLQHALEHRPDEKDLVNRNILHQRAGSVTLQQKQHELEKAMAHDLLKKNLAKRPLKEELLQKNILPENSNIAPSLQAAQRDLEKSMLEDSLRDKLAHRPKPEEVIMKGILTPDEDPTKV